MITFLEGKLEADWPGRLVLNVDGVGYEVFVPLAGDGAFGQQGETTRVLTHFHVREQEQTLYGFANEDSRELFRLLLTRVSGVGPKVALSILSGMAIDDFKQAVVSGDATTLAKIKGLGKKTAERIILELGDKVGVKEAWQAQSGAASLSPDQAAQNDALLALLSLGFKQNEAQKAVKAAATQGTAADEILRAALRMLQS